MGEGWWIVSGSRKGVENVYQFRFLGNCPPTPPPPPNSTLTFVSHLGQNISVLVSF